MMVVMGIIALLAGLGVTGLIFARSGAQADAVAEELVSTIRTSQNNAIAIKNGCGVNTSKVWGVEVASNDFKLVTFCGNTSGLTSKPAAANLSPYPASITLGGSMATENIYFSAPLGTGYSLNSSALATTDWTGPRNPDQDYAPTSYASPGDQTLTITVGSSSRNVIVKTNGDVYEQ